MANEQIKAKAKATPDQVARAVTQVPLHKEPVKKKIYIGPNVPGLIKYTVVDSIKTPHVQNMIAECATIEKLFVDVSEIADAEQKAKMKGTLEYRNYQKVAEFKGGTN